MIVLHWFKFHAMRVGDEVDWDIIKYILCYEGMGGRKFRENILFYESPNGKFIENILGSEEVIWENIWGPISEWGGEIY